VNVTRVNDCTTASIRHHARCVRCVPSVSTEWGGEEEGLPSRGLCVAVRDWEGCSTFGVPSFALDRKSMRFAGLGIVWPWTAEGHCHQS
jgi:hypothetical protein